MREFSFRVDEATGDVPALLLQPESARFLLVYGHGAGAGMQHAFMEATCQKLAPRGVATLRYQFPYMQRGSRRPDPRPRLLATVRAAMDFAVGLELGLPILAGGKSMGGRMTSLALSESPRSDIQGVVFFGFPLHAPGKGGSERAKHLAQLSPPMLFLQGTRDRLAELDAMRAVCQELGPRATLQVVEGGDHSFHVLKRSGRSDDEVLEELAQSVASWADALG